MQVFLATSIGVLSTTALSGGGTVWAQEAASEIGNVIAGYMDYRASDRTLAIGTHGRGVFTTQFFPSVGVDDDPRPVAGDVWLGPSVPNPARRSTVISYQLPRTCEVSLRLHDVAGREVMRLVDGRQERGRHEVRLTTTGLGSGTYFYVLRAAGTVQSRKISLVTH
jgi:hypothetical protein